MKKAPMVSSNERKKKPEREDNYDRMANVSLYGRSKKVYWKN